MMTTLTEEEEDVNAKWTFNSGDNVSKQFSSDWGGVLVAPGDDEEEDDWGCGVCVTGDVDQEDFSLQPVSKIEEEEPEPEPPVEKMAKLKLEFVSPKKMTDIVEDEDEATTTTCRDSFSSRDSDAVPPAPKSPAQSVLSPMQRARLTLSKKAHTQSARAQQKASLKMSLNTLAFTGAPLEEM